MANELLELEDEPATKPETATVIELDEPSTDQPTVTPSVVKKPVEKRPAPPFFSRENAEGYAAALGRGTMRPIFGLNQFLLNTGKGVGALMDFIPGATPGENPISRVVRSTEDKANRYKGVLDDAAKFLGADDHPVIGAVGEATSPVNLVAGQVASKLPVASNLVKSGLAGAASGAMDWVDDVKQYWSHKLTDILAGGAVGTAAQGVGSTVSTLLRPAVQEAVSILQKHGVDVSKMTLGQLIGGKMRAFEDWVKDVLPNTAIEKAQQRGLKEFNVAPVREAVKTVGKEIDESKPMFDIFKEAHKHVSDAYNSAVGAMPLIESKAMRTASGDYSKAYGSPAFAHRLRKDAEAWKSTASKNTAGDARYAELESDILEAFKPFTLEQGKVRYADPKKLHDAIKTLNEKISQAHSANKSKPKEYHKEYEESLTKLRNHLRGLMKETAPGQYVALRAADAAHAGLQVSESASKAAAHNKYLATPEQMITASIADSGKKTKTVSRAEGRLQRYGMAGQDVVGDVTRHPHMGGIEHLLEVPLAAVANAIPALTYGPRVQGALSRYAANPGPVRKGLAAFARDTPVRLGGATTAPADLVDEMFLGRLEEAGR